MAIGRTVEIEGPNLALARFRAEDLEAVHAFASDPEVCRFTTWGPNSPEQTRAFLAEAVAGSGEGLTLAVLRGDDLIGSAAVWRNEDAAELGYTLRRDVWGRGHATEVASLLLQLGAERWGLSRFLATCSPRNLASIRVLEKVGFTRQGTVLVAGRDGDSVLFARSR